MRLVYLQTVMHAELQARAERQQQPDARARPAKRGDIVDRRGNVLATSVDADSVYAVPSELKDKELAVTRLCDALGDCTARDRQKLLERFAHPASLRLRAAPDLAGGGADASRRSGSTAIGFIKESRRFYPNKELAAHTLGYVGIDNKGLSGIESAYDSQIRGKDGTVLVHDRRPRARLQPRRASADGRLVDRADHRPLPAAHRRARAARRRGSRIVPPAEPPSSWIPRTGEILAMANEPTFNPNVFGDSPEAARRNRAVQDLYEPDRPSRSSRPPPPSRST